MVASVFPSVDGQSVVFSGLLAIAASALLSGVVSMMVYRRFSQQERLRELDRLAAKVQLSLRNHDDTLADALPLIRQNIVLAVRRLKLSLLPSLLASVPILIALVGLEACHGSESVLPFGASWARSWLAFFLVVSCVAALLTKMILRIR